MPETRPLHELLPWYATGTLDPGETETFRKHLATCEGCTEEMAAVDELRSELEREGDAFFRDHPDAERLVAAVRGDLDESATAEVRRHLALCSACATEARWIRGEAVAGGLVGARDVPVATPSWGWVALAAAAVLAAVLMLPLRVDRSVSGVVKSHLIQPIERSGEGANVIEPQAGPVGLAFPVDMPEEAFPVTIELLDASGGQILLEEDIGYDLLFEEQMLQLNVDRTRLPAGRYDVTITGSDEDVPEQTFAFTISDPGS